MKKKKMEASIKTLIINGVRTRHRSMFVIVGDNARVQIVKLHRMLSKSMQNAQPDVLWFSKDQLNFSDHQPRNRGKVDKFSLFIETCKIKFCSYEDSQKVLGKTFGMCVLQDFSALTPNILARTIETVAGGGLVVLMLPSLSSLTSLYTMDMDVYKNFRTESHLQLTARFNERFVLSLASCKACIVMDDELNILPISSHMKSITLVSAREDCEGISEADQDLKNLKEQLSDVYPVGPLLNKCCTLDQGKAVMTFLDSVLDKTLPRCTVALLSARGRGKSAALGLAVAGAVAEGYSNIFITAPSPEDVKTLFDFVLKGFELLGYKDPEDYDLVRSGEPELKKAIVQINIYRKHRQTIQYVQPSEHAKLSQVELLVVDEAAAIPLSFMESLVGPYLVFLSSTVHGYEGTGRALSKKLVQHLEKQSHMPSKSIEGTLSGRLFKKIDLNESIRYSSGDPIESWLNALLCLDVTSFDPSIKWLPAPNDCDLYYVNRDTLFSYNKDSEVFLQRMMGLHVASHFKNSPDDLQLMADAPGNHLFVLLGPVDESKNLLPDILCVVQVCLEGQLFRESAMKSLIEGHQPFGDQITWKFCELFRDSIFPTLSGGHIVHIATHPSAMELGYESVAVELLERYFEGQLTSISEAEMEDLSDAPRSKATVSVEQASLLEENIKPRSNLEPLLMSLRERQPEKLDYLSVSFQLTLNLFGFWRKHKFSPFYIGHIPNSLTGEYKCMVLKPLNTSGMDSLISDECGFFGTFYQDFRRSFIRLLRSIFRSMHYKLAMSVLDPKINYDELDSIESSSKLSHLNNEILSPYDMQRLEAYTNNLADYHMILDLIPTLAREYFMEKLPVTISPAQASVLLCMGLQGKNIFVIEGEMKLERQQILSLFIKVMKKFYKYLYGVASKEIESTLPRLKKEITMEPHEISVDEDLNEAAKEVQAEMRAKMNAGLDPELLQRFSIPDQEAEFEIALQKGMKIPPSGLISLKSNRDKLGRQGKEKKQKTKKRNENDRGSSKKWRS
ncbi:RNA processing factor [Lithospermum erythrorhizon]|uniref:RNA cytidine acetyltransferase n=1 Tax=Lithospermum erythrorhizon TaxID=34254 RepID=A0AAV3P6S3_LITER